MKQKDDLVTKSFLKSEINSLRDELTEQIKQSKDETLTHLDKIMGLLRKLDEEKTIGAYRQREQSDQLENHENRITNLETATTA